MADITECEGYKKLLKDVESFESKQPRGNHYREKLQWVVDRANHYAEKTGLDASQILDQWEKNRDYWFLNYYQDCNQPLLVDGKCRIFETIDDLEKSIGNQGFRCPLCEEVSTNPYECNSGAIVDKKTKEICDWKVYGLFKDMGKGMYIFVKSEMRGQKIFMPIAWEKTKGA